MMSLVPIFNAIAFTALFIVYGSGGAVERPAGVRRALQTYARVLTTGVAVSEPPWKVGIELSDLM